MDYTSNITWIILPFFDKKLFNSVDFSLL